MDRIRIGNIATITRGVSYKKDQANKEKKQDSIALLRANNIDDFKFNYNDLVFISNSLVSEKQHIKCGDIIISMSSGSKNHVGKVAIAKSDMSCTYGAFCAKITPAHILPDYLFYVLRSGYFRKHIESCSKGTNINNLKREYILDFEIPLPSEQEQQRIVTRIEELFSELDSAVETLQKTKQQLEVYRQAVLKEAFDSIGEFVPFGTIIESRLGKMLDKEKNTGNPELYLRNINVRWFSFDLSDLLEMRIEPVEYEKYSLKCGDLVVCEGGEPGRCAVWDKESTIYYQKALHRIRFTDGSNPNFYMYYLWLAAKTGRLNPYYTGTGIKHLTGQSLVKIPVPICSRTVQDKLVLKIEYNFSVCDGIEKTINEALQQAEAMRQSILKKAFEGNL